MLNILYIRFPNSFNGGVKSYSSMMMRILLAHAKDEVCIVDLSKCIEDSYPNSNAYSGANMRSILSTPEIVKILNNVNLALADIGLMEHRELIFIYELKKKFNLLIHNYSLGF